MITNKIAKRKIEDTLRSKDNFSDIFILLGGLNKTLIVSSIQIIEQKLKKLNYKKAIISKAKLISIELLDNMLKHQCSEPDLTPFFELTIDSDKIKFTAGNCISSGSHVFLNEKLNRYLSFSTEKLKSEYIELLKNGDLDSEGNAGLGLLTILKRSNKNYDFDFEQLSDSQYYFNNSITITNNQINK